LPADLLRAGDYFLDTRQILGQALPPRMRTPFARRDDRERSAPCFRLHLIQCCARLFLGQQLQLQIAQGPATRPQQFHPLTPQFSVSDWIFRCAQANSRSRTAMRGWGSEGIIE
jgi:hypothetical protein